MKNQKGFATAALIVIGILVLGGLAYYSFKTYPGRNASSTPAAALTANTEEVTSADVTTVTTPSADEGTSSTVAASDNASEPTPAPAPAVRIASAPLVEITQAGTLAQRLGLTTLTDVDYSFAISYPKGWTSSGPSNGVLVTNGRSTVFISSQDVPAGTTAEGLAAMNGVANGFITTSVNAYRALESVSGVSTTYFIVNGAVGYKITVTDLGDSGVLQTILLTFTVTKQR